MPGQTPSHCAWSKTSRTAMTRSPKRSPVMGCDEPTHRGCASALWMGGRSVP
jgi:hypothetical protein